MNAEPDQTPAKVDLDLPFTRAQLRAAGGDPSLLRNPDYVNVIKRVWVRAAAMNDLTLLQAALLIHPRSAFASHLSAAAVHGLPVPDRGFVHVTVGRAKDRRFRPEIKPHVTDRKKRVVVVKGIRATDAVTTFIDCAGMLGLIDMVILGDALVKRFRIKPTDLVRACELSTDYYAKLALIAAGYVREGVDSPMETRLRMLIVLAGLPEPTVNHRLFHEDGTWRRRFDLCYLFIKLIVEYDGQHHAEPGQREKDIARREEFDDEGFRIIVVTASGIFREPGRTLRRIRRQLILRGMPDVPEIDDRWQEFFAA